MKKCLIIVNTHKPESQKVGNEIEQYLRSKGISSLFLNFDGVDIPENIEKYSDIDFVITLGGDGTVLFAARTFSHLNVPIFPVNFGQFGFIASIEKNEWHTKIDDFLAGRENVSERNMVQVSLRKKNSASEIDTTVEKFSAVALNDIVIAASHGVSTVLLDVLYNGVSLGEFKADGIIVSTATGSTAYSASAGGPIIDPDLDALVLTPINSFSLSVRPLVVNPHGEFEVVVLPCRADEVAIIVDGQKPVTVNEGDKITIKKSPNKAKLVGCTSQKFYDALRSKLNWSGGPHARNPDN